MKTDLHLKSNPQIPIEDLWHQNDPAVIDVRSPSEFMSGSYPTAVNIPLLENSEREAIGILYKEFGQQKAVEKGYDFLEKKLNNFSGQFDHIPKDKLVIVYCARGGMRSQVVTSFLRYLEYDAKQLTGGYKAFRNWTLDQLDAFQFFCPIVLHGQTGVGKTLVLKQLENALDLEGLANHRGSIFGGIGKQPVTQKNFEAGLLVALAKLDNSKPIYIEGESRKIGDVSIPNTIFAQMKSARNFLLEASIETRVARTIEEYVTQQPHTVDTIKATIKQLKADLGNKQVAELIDLLEKKDFSSCFKVILLSYYDRKYAHSMRKLEFSCIISAEAISQACMEIKTHTDKLLKQFDTH